MSRDFVIYCKSSEEINKNYNILNKIYVLSKNNKKKEKAFKILKKRKDSIFVTLTYPYDINEDDVFLNKNKILNIKNNTDFVAIKNGEHNSDGYFFTNISNYRFKEKFNIKKIHKLIINYFSNA